MFGENWVNELELWIIIQTILNLHDMMCVEKYSRGNKIRTCDLNN